MKRLVLALSVLAVVVSSCGIGVRKLPTENTETTATLTGLCQLSEAIISR